MKKKDVNSFELGNAEDKKYRFTTFIFWVFAEAHENYLNLFLSFFVFIPRKRSFFQRNFSYI